MAAPIETCHVVVINNNFAQSLKQKLESFSFWDDRHRILKLPNNEAAVPVRNEAVDKLVAQPGLIDGISFRIEIMPMPYAKKKCVKTPQVLLNVGVRELWESNKIKTEWNEDVQSQLPTSWEKHGDLVLLPENAFKDDFWQLLGEDLWKEVAKALSVKRVARKSVVSRDGYRSPQVSLLLGDDGWVEHIDNGIKYTYDATKCMFSAGNITEKLRVANFKCSGETVVDLYAGIGYFSLPYLVHAGATYLHACEWNPAAAEALQRNLILNKVADRATVHPGDNRLVCPRAVADRVNLGLIPSSEDGWETACAALKPHSGGILHIHQNITSRVKNPQHPDSTQSDELPCNPTLGNSHNCDTPVQSNQYATNCSPASATHSHSTEGDSQCFSRNPSGNASNQSSHTLCDRLIECESRNNTGKDTTNTHPAGVTNVACEANQDEGTDKTDIRDLLSHYDSDWDGVNPSWQDWCTGSAHTIRQLLEKVHGGKWACKISHIEKVKSYAPHVDHLVLDLLCEPVH